MCSILIYGATKNVYNDFLPVAEEMVKSLNSGNILSPDDESALATDNSSKLPPLTESRLTEPDAKLFLI